MSTLSTPKTNPNDAWREAIRGWTADVETLLGAIRPRDEASNELFARVQQHGEALRASVPEIKTRKKKVAS